MQTYIFGAISSTRYSQVVKLYGQTFPNANVDTSAAHVTNDIKVAKPYDQTSPNANVYFSIPATPATFYELLNSRTTKTCGNVRPLFRYRH